VRCPGTRVSTRRGRSCLVLQSAHSSRIREEVVAYKREIATICDEYYSSGDVQVREEEHTEKRACVPACMCELCIRVQVCTSLAAWPGVFGGGGYCVKLLAT
jgi:hypothetical protein